MQARRADVTLAGAVRHPVPVAQIAQALNTAAWASAMGGVTRRLRTDGATSCAYGDAGLPGHAARRVPVLLNGVHECGERAGTRDRFGQIQRLVVVQQKLLVLLGLDVVRQFLAERDVLGQVGISDHVLIVVEVVDVRQPDGDGIRQPLQRGAEDLQVVNAADHPLQPAVGIQKYIALPVVGSR